MSGQASAAFAGAAIQYFELYRKVVAMPVSLRLPAEIESQIAGFGERLGLTKSAVIVRSIQEYLARHAQPSSLEIYEQAMRDSRRAPGSAAQDEAHAAREQRTHKLQARAAIRRKHAQRSSRASGALSKTKSARKPKST